MHIIVCNMQRNACTFVIIMQRYEDAEIYAQA